MTIAEQLALVFEHQRVCDLPASTTSVCADAYEQANKQTRHTGVQQEALLLTQGLSVMQRLVWRRPGEAANPQRVEEPTRAARSVYARQRSVTPDRHATQAVQTVLGTEERADVQLPAVGWLRGGYSHRMSPRASQKPKVPPSSAKRENLPASRRTHKPSPIACSAAAICLRSAACPAP